jgi:DNA-binding transcriptional MerR regulator
MLCTVVAAKGESGVGEHMQIGEVAERTGLSLRTIRYYEEVGLVVSSARSQGGFRLYTEPDVVRLDLVKRMKPLGFQLDEMGELLAVLDPDAGDGEISPARLREFAETAEQRCVELRAKLSNAEEFAEILRARLSAASQG